MIEEETIIEIPFYDVDVMEIAWHGNYIKYMEVARCELLEKIDYNYPQMKQSGYGWPVIDVHVRYLKSLKFQQKVRIKTKLVEWENRLKVTYLFEDAQSGERLTKAHTVQVAVDMRTGEMQLVSPPVLLQRLEEYSRNGCFKDEECLPCN